MNSCYLLVGRPPPPPPSILLQVSKCNFVARRGPRVKILQNSGSWWNSCCCHASKKSARRSSDGDDDGNFGLLDDDIVGEGDGSSEITKQKQEKTSGKTAISADSKDNGEVDEKSSKAAAAVAGKDTKVKTKRGRPKKVVPVSDEQVPETRATKGRTKEKDDEKAENLKELSISESNGEDDEKGMRGSRGRESSKAAVRVVAKDAKVKAKRGRPKKVVPVSGEQVTETKATKGRTKEKADEKAENLKELSIGESNGEVDEKRMGADRGRESSKAAVAAKDTKVKAKRGRPRKVVPVSDEQVTETKATKGRTKEKADEKAENLKELSISESNGEVDEKRMGVDRGRESSKAAVAVAAKDTKVKAKRGRPRKVVPVSDEQVTETKKADERAESLKELSISEDLEPTSTSMPKTKKKIDASQEVESSIEVHDSKELETSTTLEAFEEEELHTMEEDDEDVAYPFPPLVCCFGAAQHFFIPSGRPANRMIDYEIHEGLKDMLWSPDKFVRAPGGSSSSVALALGNLGGRVAFMGKLGDDAYGECMLHHLNVNNVQTRAVKIDRNKLTTLTRMKILRAGGLRATPIRTCAEDNLLGSDISKAVLKEAKIFYFNSMSLLDPGMRKTTLRTIKTSKKFGGLIFYDLNLPFSLWNSRVDTITFIQEAWNLADVIEVTKQELEFICGIEPTENFDTKDNDISKFKHYRPEVIMPLWHENLKVLFVTNGTSKIHFYTENDHGFVLGMDDAPITPSTADMSAAGDAIVAGLMKMLSVGLQHITDKGYLKRAIKYAIVSGIADQWKLSRTLGFPPREQDEGFTAITEREWRTVGREEEPYYCSEDLY